ncbi:hypothetical protein, partial [Enterobacter hormaechei]|uniref:hypothetical protein n=1 Tax=Enterobacter hormaechei TaxID=158836 RepID=UPI003A971E8A
MEWYRKKGYSSIGDLFKRNSTDRIEETWLVNKEVGAIELAEALQGFTSKEVKWFTEFGHLNRGDMLTSEQHRCHN